MYIFCYLCINSNLIFCSLLLTCSRSLYWKNVLCWPYPYLLNFTSTLIVNSLEKVVVAIVKCNPNYPVRARKFTSSKRKKRRESLVFWIPELSKDRKHLHPHCPPNPICSSWSRFLMDIPSPREDPMLPLVVVLRFVREAHQKNEPAAEVFFRSLDGSM